MRILIGISLAVLGLVQIGDAFRQTRTGGERRARPFLLRLLTGDALGRYVKPRGVVGEDFNLAMQWLVGCGFVIGGVAFAAGF